MNFNVAWTTAAGYVPGTYADWKDAGEPQPCFLEGHTPKHFPPEFVLWLHTAKHMDAERIYALDTIAPVIEDLIREYHNARTIRFDADRPENSNPGGV